ncbi:MAG: hypothetical protein AVO35_02440 [Candidatus Aegiribacteria sp. MLS_C]|nr:MAG: hypothetical protein AVO35_02440 [Candidatus Aegiribacteria sp. MLS_C]
MVPVGGLAGAQDTAVAFGDVPGDLEVVEDIVGHQALDVRIEVEEEIQGHRQLEDGPGREEEPAPAGSRDHSGPP